MYVCMYVCECANRYVCMKCMYVCMYVFIWMCKYEYVCMYVCMFDVCMYVCIMAVLWRLSFIPFLSQMITSQL